MLVAKKNYLIENPMDESVIENLSTAIILLDQDLKIVFSNQAAETLLMESSAKMLGESISKIISSEEGFLKRIEEARSLDRPLTARKIGLVTSNATAVTVDASITPLLDQSEILIELISIDRYLRIDRDAAIKVNHGVTKQMVKGLAHEIKNPLGGIKGSAQLLEKELPGPTLKEYTSIIIEETDRLTALVDRMLGPNTLPVKRKKSIHEILERVAKLMEMESKDCSINRDYDPSLPEIEIDHELLVQAVLNIAKNALQALENKISAKITFKTRVERQFTISGERHRFVIRVDISDNGPGIPIEIKEHLFYPMISKRVGGTGLGLTFAQSIISQHGGIIEFESIPGDTVFTIFLPLEYRT